ncbi:MAG TPA: hypothetical protein VFA04_26415, partial [Bryobacteraceae bacterium]|nr:hypothetical protein [Bryobacteraceae bacterium]
AIDVIGNEQFHAAHAPFRGDDFLHEHELDMVDGPEAGKVAVAEAIEFSAVLPGEDNGLRGGAVFDRGSGWKRPCLVRCAGRWRIRSFADWRGFVRA